MIFHKVRQWGREFCVSFQKSQNHINNSHSCRTIAAAATDSYIQQLVNEREREIYGNQLHEEL